MKYARYILIAVLLYLFIASIYSYVSPDITVTSGLNAPDTAPELDEGMVARYRSLILPWIPLIGLILAGWIFFFKRRFARSAALQLGCTVALQVPDLR